MTIRSDIYFAANDRLHPVCRGLVIEICCSKKIPVIGDSDGRHPASRSFGGQLADFAGTVEKGIVCVEMQMYEI